MPAEKPKEILVYYLGYPEVQNKHVTLVKGNHYAAPTDADGKLIIGGAIRVRVNDLKEFLEKNEYFQKHDRIVKNAFTTDPTLAGLAKQKGSALGAPSTVTATEALGLVDTETLEMLLAQRREQEVAVAGAAPEPVSKPKSGGGKKSDATPTENPPNTPEGDKA